MYIKMILAFLKNRDEVFVTVISMCTAFVFACVSPSVFMGYSFAWCLPGLCIALLHMDEKEK